jgi:hypothetical protein
MNVRGTPGADRITAYAARHVLVRSLTGADNVRAGTRVAEDGGPGQDVAYGHHGRDLCRAEVEHSCER